MSLVERFVIGVDIQGFSGRGTREQVELQRALDRMLDDAAESAGVSRRNWERRADGDGEFAVLPADVDLLAMVRGFVNELDIRLMDHNEDHSPKMRIRLRVAMHTDVLTDGVLGRAGPAPIVLARLLDSAPVRAALKEQPTAHLAQIISEPVYLKVVMSGLGGLRPSQFAKVLVDLPEKDFHQTAYLYVPTGFPAPQTESSAARPKPPSFPFPVPLPKRTPAATLRTESAPAAVEESPPPELTAALRERVSQVKAALMERQLELADTLTTLAVVDSADRGRAGWLRMPDGDQVPLELISALDAEWAEYSCGVWGFHAQVLRLADLKPFGRREFREVCVRLGWRAEPDEVALPYPSFGSRAGQGGPFYPTLRNPAREAFAEWHHEWESTVLSVHARLRAREGTTWAT
ncbi:GUN4-like [Amycolatopsis xylanica]|uniref:GUN4-like n=1 Tax=Amycolatopsis xylanica TaxID=589385 RepID=A0A1H2TKF4_9PSEU|nr:GUN4 domain-containing protein [Amycolatopsis xylanica]SDW43754.1 GUN4-like [Amycolatopsis xylanica]